MASVIQVVQGTLGCAVRNLIMNTKLSRSMTGDWEKVMRLPAPESAWVISSRKMTLDTSNSTMATISYNWRDCRDILS